jgi:formylglycine-generating enzyme required for sulfatase activity
MRLLAWLSILVALFLAFKIAPVFADNRVALVIGNGAYVHAPHLPNPSHDAEDVAAALRRAGFDTILGTDLDQAGMQDAAIRFARAARTADVAVFYYSGHAMQYAGVNYLVPVDAELRDEADLRRMARVDEILADLQQARNLRILVLDSCRDNPLADNLKRSIGLTRSASIGRGLAKMESPDGTIISYSTQSGRTAEDGGGRNSPYTSAFLRHIADKDDISIVFHHISANVYEATGGRQVPELSLSFFGEFYLNGKLQITATPAPADPCATAADHWKAADAIGSVAAFEDHIARFPNCAFAGLAKARIESLKDKVAIAAPFVSPATPAREAGPCGGAMLTASLSSRCATVLSIEEERALQPKDVFKECANCPEMVVVPAGSFTMGSSDSEKDRYPNEGPPHHVTIDKPFAVGKFDVTVDQYATFVNDTGYDTGTKCYVFENGRIEERQGRSWRNPGFPQSGTHPAVCLNWNDAKAYVDWLSRKTGKAYRLLTEAQWEYSARAGTSSRYSFGDDENDLCRYGNALDQTAKMGIPFIDRWPMFALRIRTPERAAPCTDNFTYTAPVGSFLPNGFGLYDMQGNVWRWLEDCGHDSYAGAPSDGSAWITGLCTFRVLRGGSWTFYPRNLRAAARGGNLPQVRAIDGSIRVARSL